MLDSDPMPHLPASAAASRALGESWCCAMTSAPASRRLWAACFSLGGSYHVPVQTTLTTALGFTAWTPRAKALTPATTVVMGCAATKPMMLVFVMEPATSPVRYRPSQSRPYTSETFGASPTAGPMPTKVTWGCCFATSRVKFWYPKAVAKMMENPLAMKSFSTRATSAVSGTDST